MRFWAVFATFFEHKFWILVDLRRFSSKKLFAVKPRPLRTSADFRADKKLFSQWQNYFRGLLREPPLRTDGARLPRIVTPPYPIRKLFSDKFPKVLLPPLFPLMNPLMATHAQTFEIALVIRPTICKRFYMMDESCHRCSTQPQAHLTKRMRCNIAIADFLPRATVAFFALVPTAKMLIVPLHLAAVFLAVAALAVR